VSTGVENVRVLAFEDPYDARMAIAVLQRYPEYDGLSLAVGQIMTKDVREEVWRSHLTARCICLSNEGRPLGESVY
jgi:hypothetical protein